MTRTTLRASALAGTFLALGTLLGAQLARAGINDRSFTLEAHDRIVAEAPGCYASCRAIGSVRSCTIRETNCHAVCQTVPECRLDGGGQLKVCAIVRDAPY